MSSVKSKQADSSGDRASAEADFLPGNPDIQVKEEPPDMDEYLKSSEAYVQSCAKSMPVAPLVKPTQSVKTTVVQTTKPVSGPSVTSKPVIVVRRPISGQQGPKNVLSTTEAQTASGQRMLKTVSSAATLVGCTSDKSETLLPSTVGGNKGPLHIQTNIAPSVAKKLASGPEKLTENRLSGAVAKTASSLTAKVVSVDLNRNAASSISSVANSSSGKNIVKGLGVKQTLIEAKSSTHAKVSAPSLGVKSVANNTVASSMIKEPLVSKAASKSQSMANVGMASQKPCDSSRPVQKAPVGSKPLADDKTTKGPILRRTTNIVRGVVDVARPVPITLTSSAAATDLSSDQSRSIQDRLCAVGDEATTDRNFAEVVIKSEPVDDYPENTATSLQSSLPEACMDSIPSALPLSSLPQANSSDYSTGVSVISNSELPSLSQNSLSTDVVRTEAESSIEVSPLVAEYCITETVEPSSTSGRLLTSLDESYVSVAADMGDGANEVSSGSTCNLVANTECSDVDLSIVKTEPLEEDHFAELSAAITSTIMNDECSDSIVASNAVLNIHSENVFTVDDLNLSQTLHAPNESISDSISNLTHSITKTIPEVRCSADINTVFGLADATTDSPPEVTGNVVSSVELTKHVSTCNDEVDAEQNLSVLPMDLDVSDEQLTPDSVQQMSVLFDDPMTEITNSANEESASAYDIAISQSMRNISSPSKIFAGFTEASETHPLGNGTPARPMFGVLSPQAVLNRSPRSDVTQEKQIAVGLVKPLCGRKSNKFEQSYGTNKARDVAKDKETSCPARMADHDESFVAKSSMKNSGNLPLEKSSTFPKHSDFENQEMLMEKHMIRRKRAQDHGFDRSLDSEAKHRRSSNPRFGKENASGAMKFYTNVKMDSSHNVTRKVLAANLMPNLESDDHLEKRLMESISEYLSLETSSFLDDDLGSGCYSPEPCNAYKLRKVKQSVFNIEDKRRNWLRHKRTAFKRSSDYRQSMKKPNLDILNCNVFPFLSEFSKHSLSDCSWYMTSCEIEDIVAGHRQDLISDLNSVYIGKQPRFFLPPMAHLGNLSLETQLESQVIESVGVKAIYLAVAKEWVRKKPLHMFVNGQLKIEKKTYLPPKRTSKINVVSENCQRVFSHDICRMLANICELGESEDSLFSLPDGLSQFTTNRVFRKVKQYLRNYVKRLRRNWGLAKEPLYESKNFQEDSFFSKTRTKPRDHSVVSDYAVDLSLPSPDTVIRMQETKLVSSHEHLRSLQQNSVATGMTSLQQESEEQESENSSELECGTSYQNEVTTSLLTPVTSQPVTGTKVSGSAAASYDNFDRFLSVNTRRLSMETSEPLRTSVSSVFDSFCKEAEDICEQVGKSKDAVSFNTRSADTPDDVIDSSKLYSPTRPTDMEEQELLVTSNVAAINKKSLPSDTSTLEVRNHDGAFSGANQTERGSGRESKLATNESIDARKRDGDKVIVSNTDVRMADKLILPKVTEKEHSDESEIEIHITLDESFTESEAEIPKQQTTVCSQITAVKQKDVIMKKVDDNSIKRKKRKSTKEKKAKKRKDKSKSEVCESSEKDRPRKKRKYRHTSEENKENAPAMFHEDPNNTKLLQVCKASASDAVYTDSYTSVVEDVMNPVPASNFDDYFDPLLPPGGHYRNPFRLSWSLLEWFITKNTDALSKAVGIIPDVKRFNAQILKPQTSFLWSLVLAVFDVVRQEPAEPESGKKGGDQMGDHHNLKPNTEEMVDISNVGDDGVKKVSVKGSNPLMQAFRQVVEAKRRLSKDSQKPKSVSAISKLSAELAARRAAPKSAKPLYKPSGKQVLPEAGLQQQQNSESVDINPQINDDQSAQLVKEALVDFYEEVKKLLDGHDDIDFMDSTMYDSSSAHISDGNLHLEAVSSLVFSLYENYEEYCKQLYDQNENNEQSGQLQEETTIIIDDGNVEYGDNVITLSSDGINQSSKGNLEERGREALEADANQVADESEGIVLSTESGIEAAVAPLDEKQISISKNIEGGVEVLAKTTLGLDDRQYISSFPPIGPAKKKTKVHSQVPRMVFAKLIGPALERLGTMAVGTSGSSVPSEILAANSSTNTLNAVLEAATSSASSAADAVSAVSRATDVRKPAEASSVVESLVVSHAVVSTSVVENIALPSITVSTGSNLSSSKTITRSTSAASSTSTSQLLISVASVSAAQSDATSLPIPSSSAFITGSSLVSSASAPQTSVSSSATITVTASENSGLPSSPVVKSTVKTLPPQPPLPTADSNIVPPPMPPLAFSQIENSAASSSTADSSSYYQNSYPGLLSSTSQSQDYMSGYYGYVGQPLDPNLVTSWMYDPSMHYAASAQAQLVDPNMMSYPPPMTSEQVPFYLPPTNQPPPFLPPPATGPLFPAYSSNQPAGPFSVPPPNMLPITVPPPSIPPAVLPPIMDPSVPPPSIFPSAAPLQTSVPPPVGNSFGIPWSHESSDPNNSAAFVPSSSSQPATSSSSTQSMNAPQYALEQQQQQQQNDPLHSVHEIIKYPPPPLPGGLQVSTSAVTSSQVQQNPSMLTANKQFSNQSGNILQPNQESFATKSLNSGAGEHANSISSQGLHLGNGNDESQNQGNSSKANALPSNQVPPEEVLSKNDYDSRKQPWYFDGKQQASVPRPQQRPMGVPSQNEQMSNQESGWSKEMQEQPQFGRGSLQQDSFESNNSMRQHGLDGPEQRPPGPRIIPPNVQPRQPTPQQMLKNPQTRQPGSEPRQFGLQQRPSGSELLDSSPRTGMLDSGPRHPGQHIRPSDPKQMGSGVQFRQAGPESGHFGQPEERHPGPVPRHNADALRRSSDSSAAGSSVQTKQLNPQLGSSEQGEKMHNLMPRDFNAQMRPELKQAGQWPRQPGVEPRQSGPPQRLAGPQHRPPLMPDQRPVRPGMPPRHPGPGDDQESSLQRSSHMKPGHSPHGNIRPSMESKAPDQMQGSKQPRAPFNPGPQMLSDLNKNRPVAPVGLDRRQSDPIPRFPGPPAEGPRGNSGPRGVAPLLDFKSRIHEDPKVKPLMDISLRKPTAGTDSASGSERSTGHLPSQGGISNMRFYVFNVDRPVCRAAEQILLHAGARKFDPHNINALRAMPEIRCLLLVHKEDLRNVQKIPSLLRLKRDLRVTFATFTDPVDIQQRRFITFFPRAGTMVMDLTALLACKSDVLDGICQFMTTQTEEKRTSWKLMLPSNVFNAIDFLKYKYEDDPEEHVRLAELSQAITAHKASGIVELLPEHPYRGQPRTTVEYHNCCVALQINRLALFRHFLFVTDMPRNHPDAHLFLSNGIDVLNVPEFMRCFVSCNVEHQPKLHPPYITRVTVNRFVDAAVSNAAECLSV